MPQPTQQPRRLCRPLTKLLDAAYLLHLPRGYDPSGDPWPLILFLHGSAERGDDLQLLKAQGLPRLLDGRPDFPFVVASPQCPGARVWSSDLVVGLLDELLEQHRIDSDRVYLTGLSMGGAGTWQTAFDYPERFAAIVPICGFAFPGLAQRIAGLPAWVFHGARDEVVPATRSQEMVDALRALGAPVRYTCYPEAGHDAWTETYANPEVYAWLLAHRRRGAADLTNPEDSPR